MAIKDAEISLEYKAPDSADLLCWARAAFAVARYYQREKWDDWCVFLEAVCVARGASDCEQCKFNKTGLVCDAVKATLGAECSQIDFYSVDWVSGICKELDAKRPLVISGDRHAWVIYGIFQQNSDACISVHNPSESANGGCSVYNRSDFWTNFSNARLMAVVNATGPSLLSTPAPPTVRTQTWWRRQGVSLRLDIRKKFGPLDQSEDWFGLEGGAAVFGVGGKPEGDGLIQPVFDVGQMRNRTTVSLDQGRWEERNSGWRALLSTADAGVGILDGYTKGGQHHWIALHDSTLVKDLDLVDFDAEWEIEWLTIEGISCEALRGRESGSEEWKVYFAVGFWTYGLQVGMPYSKVAFEAAMWEAHNALSG